MVQEPRGANRTTANRAADEHSLYCTDQTPPAKLSTIFVRYSTSLRCQDVFLLLEVFLLWL